MRSDDRVPLSRLSDDGAKATCDSRRHHQCLARRQRYWPFAPQCNPSSYAFALKVVFSTSISHDNIVSNMRVNIRARLPHQQASDFRTLPLAVTIENSRGLKANYQHATTAAELLHLLDKRTDLNAAVLDRFREELRFTHVAKLSDIEMSDEVLEQIGFFI
jgi:hypothetical protein